MIRWIAAYLGAAVAFAVVDGLWLTLMGPRLYKPVIGDLLAEKVHLAPAGAFYVIYVAGIVVLSVAPAVERQSVARALIAGAVLGLVAYGAYDLTNQATLRLWATRLTVTDMAYGAVASALASAAGYWAARRFGS